MGDRTWVTVEFRNEDAKKFAKIFDFNVDKANNILNVEIDKQTETSTTIYLDEMNYGAEPEAEEAKSFNLSFYLQHGDGGEYGSGEQVCLVGDMIWREVGREGGYCVTADLVDDEVVISENDIKSLKEFLILKKLTRKYLDGCKDPEFIAEIVKRRLMK